MTLLAVSQATAADPTALPAETGAYLLMLRLDDAVALPLRFKGALLPKGRYGYAGSAYGQGGIRTRCGRHLLRKGARHWHIDWLTPVACELRAAAFPGGSECDLIGRLALLSGTRFPLAGFGSSDCRVCAAHLVHIDERWDFDDVVKHLGRRR